MEINLLPWRDEILAVNKRLFIRLLMMAVLLSGLAMIVMYHLFFGELTYSKSYTSALERAKVGFVDSVKTYFQYKKTGEEVKKRLEMLRNLQRARFDDVRLLNEITKIIPKGVYLNTITRNNDVVELTGFANSNLLISSFMKVIDQSADLDVMSLKNVQTAEGGGAVTQFDLRIKLTLQNNVGK